MRLRGLAAAAVTFFVSAQAVPAQGITDAEAMQYRDGLYQINVAIADSFPAAILLDVTAYNLVESETGVEVELPQPVLWLARPGRGVRFLGVDVTCERTYTIHFRDLEGEVEFRQLEGQVSCAEFESRKPKPWKRSIKPKIAQGDSTTSDLGDLGVEFELAKELPGRFEFSFDGSATANASDPNNHWKLAVYWRPRVILLGPRFGFRPTLALTENTTQDLSLHDASGSALLSLFVHPFDGIQPIFATVGLDAAFKLNRDGRDFDDPRLHLELQWGMVGLVGKGSRFLIDWHFWRTLEDLGDPRLDPDQSLSRSYVSLSLSLPLTEDKSFSIRYADGDIPPTFADARSVHVGLEVFFGGQKLLDLE